MRLSVTVALLCIGLTMAQWPCHDWGFNGPIPNCASCQYLGSVWNSWGSTIAMSSGGDPVSSNILAYSVCTTCTTGFFLQQSACMPCPVGCNWCNTNGACNPSSCAIGYVFNPVLSNCMACPTALNCTRCAISYQSGSSMFPSVQTSTFAPINGWFQPSSTQVGSVQNGPYTCTQCPSLYYRSVTGACVACPANSAGCSVNGVATERWLTVTSCQSGYYVNGIVCTACNANCLTCDAAGPACDAGANCASGFYVDTGVCTACAANCRICDAAGPLCDNGGCATGYVDDGAGACVAATAVANCLYWQGPSGTATNLCSQCMAGYRPAANQLSCVACPTNCTQSQSSSDCELDPATGTTYCINCQVNYTRVDSYLYTPGSNTQTVQSLQGGTCVALPTNCLRGQLASSTATVPTCLQCYPGYGLVVNITTNATSCQQCPAGCLACDGLGVCTQCNITTVLVPNQCLQCPYNCSVCANATYCYNNCTKNYNYNAATGQCLPNGTERLIMAGFALISLFLYFL